MAATKNINDLDPAQAIGWGTDLLTQLGAGQISTPALSITTAGQTLWDRPASSSANAVRWANIVNVNPFVGGGMDGEDYANEVFAMGWNTADTVGVRDDTTKSCIWDTWEYKYNISDKYYHERHMSTVDENGQDHRFFTAAIPHDGGNGSAMEFTLDTIVFNDFAGNNKVQFNLASNSISMNGMGMIFADAGIIMQQSNAAHTAFLTLPHFNAEDELVLSGSSVRLGDVLNDLTARSNIYLSSATDNAVMKMGANNLIFGMNWVEWFRLSDSGATAFAKQLRLDHSLATNGFTLGASKTPNGEFLPITVDGVLKYIALNT